MFLFFSLVKKWLISSCPPSLLQKTASEWPYSLSLLLPQSQLTDEDRMQQWGMKHLEGLAQHGFTSTGSAHLLPGNMFNILIYQEEKHPSKIKNLSQGSPDQDSSRVNRTQPHIQTCDKYIKLKKKITDIFLLWFWQHC